MINLPLVELKPVNIVIKLKLELFTMLKFKVGSKVFISCLVIWLSCRLFANELQILVVPKGLTMLLKLKQIKEEQGKINEGIRLSSDLRSTKLSQGSSMLFVAIGIIPSLILTGKCLRDIDFKLK